MADRLVREGRVRVDGTIRPKSHRLEDGQVVEVELPDPPGGLAPATPTIPVLYDDDTLFVVDKPAGLVVHPGAGVVEETLAGQLLSLGAAGGSNPDRPGIVHRLDRDTSGLLLVARSDEAHAALQEMIRRRAVERRYLALVRGRARSRSGRIDAPMGRDRRSPTRRSLDTAGPRDAVTQFELIEQLSEHALLEVTLETGRTHQIRVHLQAVGLPVSGDPEYGFAGDLGLARQFLHAHCLRFVHPFTGADVDVRSPLPPDLEAALGRARTVD
jgi:23S rRNA pseudouridine1911/1915/1917 synthase